MKEVLHDVERVFSERLERKQLAEEAVAEMQKTVLMDSESMVRKVLSGLVQHEDLILTVFFDCFFLYGRCCSFLGPTIFDGPYCWLFNCSYFASIIMIIIIIIIIIMIIMIMIMIMIIIIIIMIIIITIILRKMKAGYSLGKNQPKLNHLLYMDDLKLFGQSERDIESLVNTVHRFSCDIGMRFGIEKCGVIIMKRGKMVTCDGIELPDGEKISEEDRRQRRRLQVLGYSRTRWDKGERNEREIHEGIQAKD